MPTWIIAVDVTGPDDAPGVLPAPADVLERIADEPGVRVRSASFNVDAVLDDVRERLVDDSDAYADEDLLARLYEAVLGEDALEDPAAKAEGYTLTVRVDFDARGVRSVPLTAETRPAVDRCSGDPLRPYSATDESLLWRHRLPPSDNAYLPAAIAVAGAPARVVAAQVIRAGVYTTPEEVQTIALNLDAEDVLTNWEAVAVHAIRRALAGYSREWLEATPAAPDPLDLADRCARAQARIDELGGEAARIGAAYLRHWRGTGAPAPAGQVDDELLRILRGEPTKGA